LPGFGAAFRSGASSAGIAFTTATSISKFQGLSSVGFAQHGLEGGDGRDTAGAREHSAAPPSGSARHWAGPATLALAPSQRAGRASRWREPRSARLRPPGGSAFSSALRSRPARPIARFDQPVRCLQDPAGGSPSQSLRILGARADLPCSPDSPSMAGAPARLHVGQARCAKVAGSRRRSAQQQQRHEVLRFDSQAASGVFKSDRIGPGPISLPPARGGRSLRRQHPSESPLHGAARPRCRRQTAAMGRSGDRPPAHGGTGAGPPTAINRPAPPLPGRSVRASMLRRDRAGPPRPQAGGAGLGAQAHTTKRLSDRHVEIGTADHHASPQRLQPRLWRAVTRAIRLLRLHAAAPGTPLAPFRPGPTGGPAGGRGCAPAAQGLATAPPPAALLLRPAQTDPPPAR